MFRHPILAAAGCAALVFSTAVAAQFVPPPPGSAQGMESGTYGSSIGYDVRGTGNVDRFGRAYDPMNPTDAGTKAAERERESRNKRNAAEDVNSPTAPRTTGPGANLNPGLSPASGPAAGPGVSPNLSPSMNPGLSSGTAGAGAAPGAAGTTSGRGGPATTR